MQKEKCKMSMFSLARSVLKDLLSDTIRHWRLGRILGDGVRNPLKHTLEELRHTFWNKASLSEDVSELLWRDSLLFCL
jgi:hypothetical protein